MVFVPNYSSVTGNVDVILLPFANIGNALSGNTWESFETKTNTKRLKNLKKDVVLKL